MNQRFKVAIFGATSAIGEAVAKRLGQRGDFLYLVGRNPAKLQRIVQDFQVRNYQVTGFESCDLTATDQHPQLWARADQALNSCNLIFIAHGDLGQEDACQNSFQATEALLQCNTLSPLSLLIQASKTFQKRKQGHIAVISSVAGDRGRANVMTYGASKAALNTYLSGLRQKMSRYNIPVLTIKPGPVDTPMTAHLKKSFLFANVDKTADTIVKALLRRQDVLYTPWFWRYVFFLIALIPERFFKKIGQRQKVSFEHNGEKIAQ